MGLNLVVLFGLNPGIVWEDLVHPKSAKSIAREGGYIKLGNRHKTAIGQRNRDVIKMNVNGIK